MLHTRIVATENEMVQVQNLIHNLGIPHNT